MTFYLCNYDIIVAPRRHAPQDSVLASTRGKTARRGNTTETTPALYSKSRTTKSSTITAYVNVHLRKT